MSIRDKAGLKDKESMQDKVLVTDIQRFAVNDGPGFRTNIFLKGCPLNCAWCHNPETKAPHPELYWKKKLCTQCGKCLDACPEDAINAPVPVETAMSEESGYHKISRSRCNNCLKCVQACRYGALEAVGRAMSTTEILDEVEKDRPFYANSGGGMTVSGGEPSEQGEFTFMLLAEARERHIHTCLDTSGLCDFPLLKALAGQADIVLFDLKHLDGKLHKALTGMDNKPILKNLICLSREGCELWVRIPVVPGFNDSYEFHRSAARFLSELPGRVARVDLLPFHNWCREKYSWLGIDWEYRDVDSLEPAFLELPADLYRDKGLNITIGGSGFEEYGSTARLRQGDSGQPGYTRETGREGGNYVKKGRVERGKGEHI